MTVKELLDKLNNLYIQDSEFFGKPMEIQFAYEKANHKLDECLQVVYDFCKENNLV